MNNIDYLAQTSNKYMCQYHLANAKFQIFFNINSNNHIYLILKWNFNVTNKLFENIDCQNVSIFCSADET